jgi:hypothetical protein
VEAVTLILTALAAGASSGVLSGLQDDMAQKAKAVYSRLHDLVASRVSGRPHAELALAEYGSDPAKWEGLLQAELQEAGAAGDGDLVAAARAVIELADRLGAGPGKFTATITGSKGVQVGDGNVQVNTFD